MLLNAVVIAAAMLFTIAAPAARAQTVTLDLTNTIIDYECYVVPQGRALNARATLTDQFGAQSVLVQESLYLCNPTQKTFNGTVYGGTTVTATTSTGEPVTVTLPHLKCYKTVPSAAVKVEVNLFTPQFKDTETANITAPQFVCTTVIKTVLTAAAPQDRTKKSGTAIAQLNPSPSGDADKRSQPHQ